MLAPEQKLKLEPKPYLAATSRFGSGADTPRAFLERCLADLSALEPKIGAFVHLNIDAARVAADQATARWRDGYPRSPIDGMPIGIKDIIETADMPTENGSPLFAGFRSERDGASVAALREAGAVIVGKTVTTEFAATEPRGTSNPHDLERTPGGSSSGSAAAVAAGMLSTALGTQVIGSTIRPASYCGCVGYKPTVGALNRGGSYDGLEPERDRRARGHSGGRLAGRPRDRGSRRRRSRLSRPVRTGASARAAQAAARRVAGDRRLDATHRPAPRRQWPTRCARLQARRHRSARTRRRMPKLAAVETAIATRARLDEHQWLGMALAAQHLPRARCRQAQPRHARPASIRLRL